MIQAQVEAIFNHPGRQAQVKRKRLCQDLVQYPSSASPTAGTTTLLGNAQSFDRDEGNARSFDYDEGNAQSFDYDEGTARSFDYDEGRNTQVKRRRVENPSATAAASGSGILSRPCGDLVEKPNGSASATAGNKLLGMIKGHVGAIFNYLGRKVQVKGKRLYEEDLVQNPSSASATAGTTHLLGTKAECEGNARSFNYYGGNARLFTYYEDRKAQLKRKRPCEDPSATATASGKNTRLVGL